MCQQPSLIAIAARHAARDTIDRPHGIRHEAPLDGN